MRHINEYIDDTIIEEGLISWLKAFIKKVSCNEKKLLKDGKVNMIKMDTRKLKIQKEPAKLADLMKDKDSVEAWNNPQLGFPESYNIAKNIKKYSPDQEEQKSDPYVYTYYYKPEETYYAAVLIYENTLQYKPNYIHIVSLETNKVVDNPTDVRKAVLEQFKQLMNKMKPSYEGFTTKNSMPRTFADMKNLGFKEDETLEEIYVLEK